MGHPEKHYTPSEKTGPNFLGLIKKPTAKTPMLQTLEGFRAKAPGVKP
jgi:hypothetical protein